MNRIYWNFLFIESNFLSFLEEEPAPPAAAPVPVPAAVKPAAAAAAAAAATKKAAAKVVKEESSEEESSSEEDDSSDDSDGDGESDDEDSKVSEVFNRRQRAIERIQVFYIIISETICYLPSIHYQWIDWRNLWLLFTISAFVILLLTVARVNREVMNETCDNQMNWLLNFLGK